MQIFLTHRFFAVGLLVLTTMMSFGRLPQTGSASQQEASPMAGSCGAATPLPVTTDMGQGGMAMGAATPAASAEFDQLYIDMMIPHHESVVALARVALPRLTDQRLTAIAQNIIETQTAEQVELREYRESFYGTPDPAPLTMDTMNQMIVAMSGMGSSPGSMEDQMCADWQVTTFCAAANSDLAFIDQVIPHHQMAVAASQTAVQRAVHPEIATFARRVIEDQNREIAVLQAIRVELTSEATPAT